ncbi:hypothetical protein GO495_31495 [Chitinophaga oryziterrae]|uniref:DUF6984 domain-containing protein n=1 Tax=Chitinophaga oryziterrae TaxID=1031224 RepID=A0A6N8JIU5_9BACT|nr:hypothetical protein [Chitinophaga oryziterrae]MVT45155.1 hypothetical protein [Chitinophaga oryziterrae]
MPQEERLLEILIKKASKAFLFDWKVDLLVQTMEDAGMGSLHLFPSGIIDEDRLFGEQVSEYQFTDEDGIDVIASLNIDCKGYLLELDIWKTDFSPLIKIPGMIE